MSQSERGGVTLIELVIVVALIGMLLAIALPRALESRRQLTLDSAATQLSGDLARARVEAVRRNTLVHVAKLSSTTYSISFVGERSLPDGVTFGPTSADTVTFAAFGPSPTGFKIYQVLYSGRSRTIRVNASGMVTAQ